LKDNPEYKPIFKTLLGSIKSKKPEDYKSLVMSPGVVRLFNDVIDKINDKISSKCELNNLSFSSYLDNIHPKTIIDLDPKNAPEEVQDVILTPTKEEEKPVLGQALSFADFKKKDKKEDEDKKEKKAIKSIEDMIQDLQKDMDKIKGSLKKEEEERKEADKKEEEEKKEEEAAEKKEEKEEKSPEKKETEEPEKEEEPKKDEEEPKDEEKSDEEDEKKDDNPFLNI